MKRSQTSSHGQDPARPDQTGTVSPSLAGGNIQSVIVVICGLIALIWIAFGQALRNAFVNYDDEVYVLNNPDVRNGVTWPGIVHAFTHFYADNWHPLTWLSHMLDCQFFGLSPAGHHFTNILLHTFAAVLLFLILRQATGSLWCSAFVAAVFAVHPLRVESVAWVAERKDVLSGVFFMLTLAAYISYARKPAPARYALVVLAFALGLMCKPMLVSLPIILVLLDYWPLKRWPTGQTFDLRLLWEKLPLFALSAASCVATYFAQTGAIKPFDEVTPLMRLDNALVAYVTYIGQMFWPVKLAVLYPFPGNGQPVGIVIAAAASMGLITAVVFYFRKSRPYLLVGWLWYVVMLVPVIGILQVGAQAHADRYTYLPQIGLYIMLAWLAMDWCGEKASRKLMLGAGAVAVLVALTFGSIMQTRYWRDSETLWTHTLACTSNNFIAHNNLGTILAQKGDLNGAIGEYRQAVQMRPDYAEALGNLGSTLLHTGDVDGAIPALQAALHFDPQSVPACINLGTALLNKGDVPNALAQMKTALRLAPDNTEANNNLAWVLAVTSANSPSDGQLAVQLAQHANQLTGGTNFMVLHTLGAADAGVGKFDDAIRDTQAALALAQAAGQMDMVNELNRELNLYKSGQALRQ